MLNKDFIDCPDNMLILAVFIWVSKRYWVCITALHDWLTSVILLRILGKPWKAKARRARLAFRARLTFASICLKYTKTTAVLQATRWIARLQQTKETVPTKEKMLIGRPPSTPSAGRYQVNPQEGSRLTYSVGLIILKRFALEFRRKT